MCVRVRKMAQAPKRDLTHLPEDGLDIFPEPRPTVLIVSVLHLDEIFITGRKWGRHPIRTGKWVKVFPFLSQFEKKEIGEREPKDGT